MSSLAVIAAGAMVVGGIVKIFGGISAKSKAKRKAAAAAAERARIERKITNIENNRQAVINPYSGVTSLAGMAENLSGQMSNPMASLGVATQAAEIQMEQTDIALANTLDTLQATGASAGGATALAQAAARGKKSVAASIETQEAANEKARAQGEQDLQKRQIAEETRMQEGNIADAARVQDAGAKGAMYRFEAQENRTNAKLDRLSGQQDQTRMDQRQAEQNKVQANAAIVGGVSDTIGAAGQMYGASDRRLKKNIKKIGKSPSGLNIYSFEYISIDYGEGVFSGVISDEVPKNAVTSNKDGFDVVDYSMLDVEFKKI